LSPPFVKKGEGEVGKKQKKGRNKRHFVDVSPRQAGQNPDEGERLTLRVAENSLRQIRGVK